MFQADTISIIAGGNSVRKIDRSRIPGLKIGVNDSFIHAECDVCVSMDRLWTENRWTALMHEAKPTYLRNVALKNILEKPPWLHEFLCDITQFNLTETWDSIHGNNSAFCALNIAYLARPKKIFLFGFDMIGKYWYPKYSWQGAKGGARLGAWAKEFGVAAKQCAKAGIDVVNASEISQITAFRKVPVLEVLTCGM